MKARILIFFLIITGFTQSLKAQLTDTLDEVIIKAKSWSENNTTIYSLGLENDDPLVSNSKNIYEAFNSRYGSNFIQYGVSGLVAPRLRGTNPEHTAVVWNGININHAGLGQSNGFNIPIQSTENIQLMYGGGSAPFGSGAIGGAILMDDPIRFTNSESISLSSSYGSFERISLTGKYSISNNRSFASIKYYRNQSQNNFEYINTADFRKPLVEQNNAAFLQNGISASFAQKLGKKDQVRFHGWLHEGITEVQPTMSNRNSEDLQKDQMHRYKLSYLRDAQFAFIELDAFYTSDDINYNGEYTGIDRFGTRAKVTKRYLNVFESGLGVNSELYIPEYSNFPENTNETRTSFFLFQNLEYKRLSAQLNLRYTHIEGYKVPVTPNLSAGYNLIQNGEKLLKVKASYSENFRLPTLNERYWEPNANPDILPEESKQWEYGFEAKYKNLRLDVVAYQMDIRNAVQWIVVDSLWSEHNQAWYTGIFSPENVNRIKSQGINSNLALSQLKIAFFNVSGGLSYNYTYARESESSLQRLYTPEQTFNLHTQIEYHNFRLGGSYQFVSERRTSSSYLDAYKLLNLSIAKKLNFIKHQLDIAFQMNNALDETYQTYINRAMPGRNYLITINYAFNN